jgi:hypothetical protein
LEEKLKEQKEKVKEKDGQRKDIVETSASQEKQGTLNRME